VIVVVTFRFSNPSISTLGRWLNGQAGGSRGDEGAEGNEENIVVKMVGETIPKNARD
jgi:hypothetical protein